MINSDSQVNNSNKIIIVLLITLMVYSPFTNFEIASKFRLVINFAFCVCCQTIHNNIPVQDSQLKLSVTMSL